MLRFNLTLAKVCNLEIYSLLYGIELFFTIAYVSIYM